MGRYLSTSILLAADLFYINTGMKRLVLTLLLALMTVPALAAAPDRPPSVMRAEQYLNALKTAKARFVQTAPDGSQTIGTFYLSRPGKLRFEYDPPVEDFIVADGLLIYFYDSQLGEQSNAPIGQTLADFLLRADLSLSGDITVSDVKRSGNLMLVELRQTDDPQAGALTLGFEENPMQLKKWRVTDATGAITEIELFQLQTGLNLPSSLFYYRNPDHGQVHYND